MKKLEIVSMVYINGEWKNQDDIPPDDFKSLLASKMDESMRNIGFKRKKRCVSSGEEGQAMRNCSTCGRRYRCNAKDRSMGMACVDYETGEDQIKKTPVQSVSEKVRNQATKKDMQLARK